MDRRTFIKLLGAVGAAIGLPVKALAEEPATQFEQVLWPRTKISQELIDDAMIDLEPYFLRAYTEGLEREFLYGTGDGQPMGFLGEIDLDELYDDGTFDGCNDYVNAYDGGSMADAFESDEGEEWHHYAITWHDDDGTLWLDGKQVGFVEGRGPVDLDRWIKPEAGDLCQHGHTVRFYDGFDDKCSVCGVGLGDA